MQRLIRRSVCAVCTAWAGVSLLAVAQAQDAPNDPLEELEKAGNGSVQKARIAWFYDQRAYPHETIPAGARTKAWQQIQARLAAEQAALARGKNQTDIGTWQLSGHRP